MGDWRPGSARGSQGDTRGPMRSQKEPGEARGDFREKACGCGCVVPAAHCGSAYSQEEAEEEEEGGQDEPGASSVTQGRLQDKDSLMDCDSFMDCQGGQEGPLGLPPGYGLPNIGEK